MGYLSYNEAVNRSKFLAESSASSLGILISTGDLFQIRNLLRSFTTRETVAVWLYDEKGRMLLFTDKENRVHPSKGDFLHIESGQAFLLTHHPIIYNEIYYGDLTLLNLLQVNQWIYISLFLLASNTIFFFRQTKSLEKLSLRLGVSVRNIVHLFEDETSDDKEVDRDFSKEITNFREIDQLTENVRSMLQKIRLSAKFEKEAAIGRITEHLSHDLRAPLGTFERLLHTPDDRMPTMRGAIRDSLNRLNSMIESLRHSEVENLAKKIRIQN